MSKKSNVVPLFGTQTKVDDKAKKDGDAIFEVSLSFDSKGDVVAIMTDHFPEDESLTQLLAAASKSVTAKLFDAIHLEDEEVDGDEIITLSLDEGDWWGE